MPSQDVLSALESLHREIEKLEPAIRHVETAQLVTQTVKAIPEKHMELLQQVKNNDAEHKEALKQLFEKELSSFTAENKRLQKQANEIQQQILLEQEALAKVKEAIQHFHERVEGINFPERLDKINQTAIETSANVKSAQKDVASFRKSVENTLDKLESSQQDLADQLNTEMLSMKSAFENRIRALKRGNIVLAVITWLLIIAGVVFIKFIKL